MVVYKVTNLQNGKCYIGATKQPLNHRRIKHQYAVKTGSEALFHNALRKYGESSFTWEVLHTCKDREELSKMEAYYTDYYDSFNNGYNMQTGGDSEYIISELVKEKLSIASKGKPKSEEHRKNIKKNHADVSGENNPMYGKHHTKEAREKISKTKAAKGNYWTGRKHSEESRAKMRKSQQEYHRKKREGLL